MALLYSADFEAGTLAGFSTSGTVAASSTQKHAGTWSCSFAANTGTVNYIRRGYTTVAKGVRVFCGLWIWIPTLPVTNSLFPSFLENNGFGASAAIQINTAGLIRLDNSVGTSVVDGPTISTSTWTNIEYSCRIPVAGTTDTIELIVNGVSYGSVSTTVGSAQIEQSRNCCTSSPSTGITTGYIDDLQINDDTGGSNNSWPSGFGAVAASARPRQNVIQRTYAGR